MLNTVNHSIWICLYLRRVAFNVCLFARACVCVCVYVIYVPYCYLLVFNTGLFKCERCDNVRKYPCYCCQPFRHIHVLWLCFLYLIMTISFKPWEFVFNMCEYISLFFQHFQQQERNLKVYI